MRKWIGILLAALILISAIGCVDRDVIKRQENTKIPVSADNGAPDEVIRSFLSQFVVGRDSNDYTYEAKHDAYKVTENGEEYILDYVDFRVTEYKDTGMYTVDGNVIFNCRRDGYWGWNNWSSTTPQLVEDSVTVSRRQEEDLFVTPTPSAEPTVTQMPSSFLFGGVEVQAGQSAVRVKGKKDAIIRISSEEMDLLVRLCPNLTKLVLDYCCMADYSKIGKLTSLKELEITTTTHEKDKGIPLVDIDWISSLQNLRSLTLCYNEISDIRAIAELSDLEELNLAWNKLTDDDLDWLSDLKLRKLYLYGNYNLKNISALASIRSLKLLHIGGCRKITKIDALAKLPHLEELDVSYCPLKDLTFLYEFKELKTLRLEHSEYVDFYYYYDLGQSESLETVVISKQDTEIEKAIRAYIRDSGSDLEIVYWEDYHEQ